MSDKVNTIIIIIHCLLNMFQSYLCVSSCEKKTKTKKKPKKTKQQKSNQITNFSKLTKVLSNRKVLMEGKYQIFLKM